MAETICPKKVKLSFFIDLLVQFRNKKIGHGSLTASEAKEVVDDLKSALVEWLANLKVLQDRHLVYIRQVNYAGDRFVYTGIDLTFGTSIYPARFTGKTTIQPDRFYLKPGRE